MIFIPIAGHVSGVPFWIAAMTNWFIRTFGDTAEFCQEPEHLAAGCCGFLASGDHFKLQIPEKKPSMKSVWGN